MSKKQSVINRLLSDDAQSSEKVAELLEIIRDLHRKTLGGCQCDICTEVEQSQKELEGVI